MNIIYTEKPKSNSDIFSFYESIGWNSFLNLTREQIIKGIEGSWYAVYAYDGDYLIGNGRVISDGVINAYLCGLGVLSKYRNRGIATEINKRLVSKCKSSNLRIQFFCEENLVPLYEKMGFEKFAAGMKL